MPECPACKCKTAPCPVCAENGCPTCAAAYPDPRLYGPAGENYNVAAIEGKAPWGNVDA